MKKVPEPTAAAERMKRLLNANSTRDQRDLVKALSDTDPFIRSAAISSLAKPLFRSRVMKELEDKNPHVRLGALLALRRAKYDQPLPLLKRFLADPDEQIRRMALIWTGEVALTPLVEDINRAPSSADQSATLFNTWLATADLLAGTNSKVVSDSPQKLLERFVADETKSVFLRARCVALLPDVNTDRTLALLAQFVRGPNEFLRFEAVSALARSSHSNAVSLLKSIAFNSNQPADLRAEAILSLADQPADVLPPLVELLDDPAGAVQVETIRTLRKMAEHPQVLTVLRSKSEVAHQIGDLTLVEHLNLALHPLAPTGSHVATGKVKRPVPEKDWPTKLQPNGDPRAGRRVFFHPAIGCAKCHCVQGRGGQIGPDLSTIGRSNNRAKLIDSILEPSQDIAPQFVTWTVETREGQTYSGLIASRGPDGSLMLATADAKSTPIPAEDISSARQSKVSLMPDGLESALTAQDFRDLLAFLLSLK